MGSVLSPRVDNGPLNPILDSPICEKKGQPGAQNPANYTRDEEMVADG